MRLRNKLIIVILLALTFLGPVSSMADEVWKPYVCKVLELFECKQGRNMIFPVDERYSDEETCYREFKRLLESDRDLDRRYPQTADPATSYIFGCVKEKQ